MVRVRLRVAGIGLWLGLALGPLSTVIFNINIGDPQTVNVMQTQTVDKRVIISGRAGH